MWNLIKPNARNLRVWQLGVLLLLFVVWHVLTAPGLLGFQVNGPQLQHSSGAKVGKAPPPPPPAPPRI